jgi:hypothetical protein
MANVVKKKLYSINLMYDLIMPQIQRRTYNSIVFKVWEGVATSFWPVRQIRNQVRVQIEEELKW